MFFGFGAGCSHGIINYNENRFGEAGHSEIIGFHQQFAGGSLFQHHWFTRLSWRHISAILWVYLMESIHWHVVWVWYLNSWGDAGRCALSVCGPVRRVEHTIQCRIWTSKAAKSWTVPTGLWPSSVVSSEISRNQHYSQVWCNSQITYTTIAYHYHTIISSWENYIILHSTIPLLTYPAHPEFNWSSQVPTARSSKVSCSMTMLGWSNNLTWLAGAAGWHHGRCHGPQKMLKPRENPMIQAETMGWRHGSTMK